MSKETLDIVEFILIVYIALFVTVIGFRQINQNKDEWRNNIGRKMGNEIYELLMENIKLNRKLINQNKEDDGKNDKNIKRDERKKQNKLYR